MVAVSIVHLDGRLLPLAEAQVPVLDRGFLFGDGAYELIPVYSRRPFRVEEHLRRLQTTLDGLRLSNPHAVPRWLTLIDEVIAANQPDDQSIYIQVTRGADVKRHHAFPAGVAPRVFIMSEPLTGPPREQRERGVAALTTADFRWLRCDLKSLNLLANCLLRQQAIDAGCVEAILLRDGFLTEGSASNVFLVKDGVMVAPPKSHLMLSGITYDVVLELAQAHGLRHTVREVLAAELRDADEIWLTSSTKEVLPVTTLDGRPVADGRPGSVYHRMYAWYQDFKARVMRGGG